MYNGIENVTICDHPLIKHKLTMIRDKNTGTDEFRAIIEEIAMLIGYEALRDLELDEIEIETPLEKAMCPVIAGKKPAIVPILRAGLGMVGGLIKLIAATAEPPVASIGSTTYILLCSIGDGSLQKYSCGSKVSSSRYKPI